MFTVLAVALTTIVLLAFLAVPFCRDALARKAGREVQRLVVRASRSVRFYDDRSEDAPNLFWIRAWGVGGAALFAFLGLLKGDLFADHPLSIFETGSFGLVAAGGSGCIVMTACAVATFLARARGHAALKRCGVKEIWTLDLQKQPADLKRFVASRVHESKLVCALDVTGQALMGEAGTSGAGILYDALAHEQNVPVLMLLMNPNTTNVDPDSKLLTVAQEILSLMDISDSMYRRRLRATLDIVKDLNEQRPPEGKIGVRFYNEKPIVRAVVFEDCAVVSPWTPQEREGNYVLFEAAPVASPASFYEVYRTHFMRLWRNATAVAEMPAPKIPSKVVRKKDLSPEQPVSMSAAKVAAAAPAKAPIQVTLSTPTVA